MVDTPLYIFRFNNKILIFHFKIMFKLFYLFLILKYFRNIEFKSSLERVLWGSCMLNEGLIRLTFHEHEKDGKDPTFEFLYY